MILYTKHLLETRLKDLVKLAEQSIPFEAKTKFDSTNMTNVLRGVWVNTEKKRPFSPLIKNLVPDDTIPIEAPFTKGERDWLKNVAKILYSQYGEPVFEYSGKYSSEIPAVKQGQNLLRLGPKVTNGSSERRYENLGKYFVKHKFNPDYKILNQAIDMFLRTANLPQLTMNFTPQYVQGLFASHASNLGYPYFRNETSKIGGKTGRELSVELTKELNSKYGATGMCSIPALIIGRDQAGGLDVDRKPTSYSELLTLLDQVDYKPSKSRVVGAIDRISNNNINVVLKAIITSQAFKDNPYFCGFRSREERHPLYARYEKFIREKQLIPINVDFSSFDTTISPEMIVIALDIIFSGVDLKGAPDRLQDAVTSKTIFTKYITYNPNTGGIETGMKQGSIPSGIGVTGLAGFICAQISWGYAVIAYYGAQKANDGLESSRHFKTFPMTGLGDDLLAVVERFEDLPTLASLIQEAFGMTISVDSVKTAVGIDFLQELFGEDKILYPLARVAESALYSERSKGLGWAEGVMVWNSQLYNIRTNPSNELNFMAALISYYDSTHLGLQTPDGIPTTTNSFMGQLKQELMAHDQTAKEALGDGDPAKENRYTSNGEIRSDYLKGCRVLAIQAKNLFPSRDDAPNSQE